MKTILLIVGLETGYAERSWEGQEKVRVYEPMSGQDKPVISDGFEIQTIHSQPVWLQTVMRISAGLMVFLGKKLRNARARGNDQMLVEVVVDFFASIQFVRWRYRRGRVFLFLDLINSLIIPQGYFALRYTILERIVQ